MIQYLKYAYNLNKTLTELVLFLAINHRVIKRPSNLLASPFMRGKQDLEKDNKMEETQSKAL